MSPKPRPIARRTVATAGLAAAVATAAGRPLPRPSVPLFASARTELGITIAAPTAARRSAVLEDLDHVADLGLRWVRFGVLASEVVTDWGDARRPVSFDGTELDAVGRAIAQAAHRGLRVCLMTVDAPPPATRPETATRMLRQYWARLAERFAAAAAMWQIFNEPDGMHYQTFETWADGPPAGYLEQLTAAVGVAREQIHAVDAATSVTTNLYGYPADDATEQAWITALDHLAPVLDLITLDAYPQLDRAEIGALPARLERISARYDTDVVIGEIGLPTCADCFTEDDQATAYQEYLDALAGSPARAAFFYQLRDGDGTTGEGTFGILRTDGTAKPARQVLERAASA